LATPLVVAEPATDAPVPIRTVAPSYPEELKDARISGIVVLRVVIDDRGNVTEPRVEKSSNAAFNQPALDAVSKWRFKPAMQGGKPVSAKVALPIKFSAES
jgi:protein TonB